MDHALDLGGLEPSPEQAELKERMGDLLLAHFRPARDAGEAESFYTTEQLFNVLSHHEPQFADSLAIMRTVLTDRGYHEHYIADQWVWAVRSRA